MPKILTAHASDPAPAAYLAARLLPSTAVHSTSLFPTSASAKMHTDDSPTSPTMSGSRAIRASPLHRGEACLTCRRRKMKCDAAKPHCGPCSRAGKADECEYEETRFLAQINRLEDENSALRDRIRELEGAAAGFLGAQQQPAHQFTAFLPGPGRRSPSDGGSSGGQPSPYGQSAPLLVHHHQQAPHPHMSAPYQHQQHAPYDQQHHTHAQLPNIVTQPQPQPQPQDWSSPGGLALQDPIQPHILQRLMHIFSRVAGTQFGLPQASINALRGSGALQEAACAAACVFARPNNGMAAYEATFAKRAVLALGAGELHDVQAGGVLAVLARAERAWAPVVGDLGPEPGPAAAVKQEYAPHAAAETEARAAQLAAQAWALVGDAQSSTAGPTFWHDVQATGAALERLASAAPSPSANLVASAAQCLLHTAVGARDKARAAAARVAGAAAGEVESLDAVVGWWIVQVARVTGDEGAVERVRGAWAYLNALRI
ncbi:hypothetical protein AURDEDRAFT_151341 [Auricularia subglabra TFB-10046 SS5]|nr:hypothetical protein AURDEDRAFT_151341 [Auricularia subglabra TFB-10046 SS5]